MAGRLSSKQQRSAFCVKRDIAFFFYAPAWLFSLQACAKYLPQFDGCFRLQTSEAASDEGRHFLFA